MTSPCPAAHLDIRTLPVPRSTAPTTYIGPSTTLRLTPAGPEDVQGVAELLRTADAARALRHRRTWGEAFPDLSARIEAGEVHLALVDERLSGTFTLTWAHQSVWGEDDGTAGYVHRLAVAGELAGRGLGGQLLDAASGLIRAAGRDRLRLDCDQDNSGLRRYYEGKGFRHVGDVAGLPRRTRAGWRTASRYERGSRSW